MTIMRHAIWIALVIAAASTAPSRAEDDSSLAADYCANFSDKAKDARLVWQTENLKKLQADVTAKIVELEAKRAELQDWVDKRDRMLNAAGKELVAIYAKMDPDAAAIQLAQLDTITATSVLRQLSARSASAILNTIDRKSVV